MGSDGGCIIAISALVLLTADCANEQPSLKHKRLLGDPSLAPRCQLPRALDTGVCASDRMH